MGKKNRKKVYEFAQKKTKKINRHMTLRQIQGKFFSTSKGGIIFELSDGQLSEDKIYVDACCTLGAMTGDIVEGRIFPRSRDAEVTKIKERAIKKIIGTFYENGPENYVLPDDKKIKFQVKAKLSEGGMIPVSGDKIELTITEYPESLDDDVIGIITAVFGDSCTREANYSAILHQCGIITSFSEKAENEAGMCEHDIPVCDEREDFRQKLVYTIDGEDAKDLDDAISVEKTPYGYILGVHIADVSHYVKENTALDKEAMARGTSVYFSDKVVPMLPVALSNGICSLNSGVDRYTLSVLINIDENGETVKVRPCKAVINSRVRGVYSEINALIDNTADVGLREKYKDIIGEPLENALKLYSILKAKNQEKGMLELETTEGKVILDSDGEPIDIVRRERGVGERLIEQFMLCANEAIASYLSEKDLPCVYRIHEKPDEEKAAEFLKFAHNLNINPGYVQKGKITPRVLSGILDKAEEKGLGLPVSYMLLRTMQKAKYSAVNTGHFGLSSACYCHFTSPIRRYPDLSVHRILSAYLQSKKKSEAEKYRSFAVKSSEKSSAAELRALDAERKIDALYKTIYMKNNIGKVYTAVISSVTSMGLFCMLENTCEGFIPIETLPGKFKVDRENLQLSNGTVSYGLGEKVMIKVESADVSTSRVRFLLLEEKRSRAQGERFGKNQSSVRERYRKSR